MMSEAALNGNEEEVNYDRYLYQLSTTGAFHFQTVLVSLHNMPITEILYFPHCCTGFTTS